MIAKMTAAAVMLTVAAQAQTPAGVVHGSVVDPLGAAVPAAKVELLDGKGVLVGTAVADSAGRYTVSILYTGRYEVRVSAPGFGTSTVDRYLGHDTGLQLTLATPTLSQEVTVTASGTPTPLAQTGAPITVLNALEYEHATELQEPLRLVPGVQLTQAGQMGGVTGMFVRGGESNYNKVLLDGVPLNDLGGAVNFANLATIGVSKIEVLRQPNSVLYGSDALAGVVEFTTTRGATPLPLLTYAVDGGNLGLFQQAVELSGAHRKLDYYTGFLRLQTSNNQPLDEFHNVTFAGNYGYAPNARTDARFTFRHVDTNAASPNALDFYGISQKSNLKEQDTYLNGTVQQQSTERWHNLVRYGHEKLHYNSVEYAPSGTLYNPFPLYGPNGFIGKQVTITGANGYSVSGQAILDYVNDYSSGPTFTGGYPTAFISDARRDFVYAQTDYRVARSLNLLGAYKYEAERGDSFYTSLSTVDRRNQSFTLQAAGDVGSRFFYALGSGIEHNEVYGNALTPRVSLAYYAVRPGGQGMFSGTKLHASFGKGVKESSVSQQNSSLYALLQVNKPALISQFGIAPLGAEYSRTYDIGLEQQFGDGRARVNASYFHNEFTNGIQYVSQSALISQLGISKTAATAAGYGAYVNSQAYRAMGGELEGEFRLTRHVFARAGYTYLDAVVQRSFSSDALSKGTFNTGTSFAAVPIGVYAPLVGARPFRRAPHSGYFGISYARQRFSGQLNGTLVGRRDDSTFLSDKDFGTSLLLPNRNLDGSYQRLELASNYRVSSRLSTYFDIQNLLNEKYAEAIGYPSLPFNIRGGVKFSFGGETFKVK